MSLTLTYFPLPGRAYVTRVCFGIGGIEYVDEKIPFDELSKRRGVKGHCPGVPLGSLPVLTLPSGKVIVESGAISRYAARRANLYPQDTDEALLVDEVGDVIGSLMSKAPQDKDPEEKKANRLVYAESGFLKLAMDLIVSRYRETPGPYLLGNKYYSVDILLYSLVKMIRTGDFDHVDTYYDAAWPELDALVVALEADSKFAPYKI